MLNRQNFLAVNCYLTEIRLRKPINFERINHVEVL